MLYVYNIITCIISKTINNTQMAVFYCVCFYLILQTINVFLQTINLHVLHHRSTAKKKRGKTTPCHICLWKIHIIHCDSAGSRLSRHAAVTRAVLIAEKWENIGFSLVNKIYFSPTDNPLSGRQETSQNVVSYIPVSKHSAHFKMFRGMYAYRSSQHTPVNQQACLN